MQSIALVMRRKPLAEGITMALERSSPDMKTHIITNYELADSNIQHHRPNVCVVEVAETGIYNVSYCLNLCRNFRRQIPSSKLLLICPENDEETIEQAVTAKKNKIIDDFVFYNACLNYLVSKIKSL